MNWCYRIIACSAIAAMAVSVAAPVLAQEAKPKPAKAAKPAAEKPEKRPGTKPAAVKELTPEDPAVAAILATQPTTPAECVGAAKNLADLSLEEFREAHPDLDASVYEALGPEKAVAAMISYGSTGPTQVKQQVCRWKKLLQVK